MRRRDGSGADPPDASAHRATPGVFVETWLDVRLLHAEGLIGGIGLAKNIVICSDGTGNRGGKTRGTNVWRIFNAVDRHNNNGLIEQITHYDDGVGTQDWRWVKLFSGAVGWGLSRNIRNAYAFLAMNYQPGDRIYLFGFSRGAYTVRSLAGVINRCGLVTRKQVVDAGRRRTRIPRRVVRAYRSAKQVDTLGQGPEAAAACIRKTLQLDDLCFHQTPIPIHFIGVWDTVDAVGVPFDEMKVIDTFWRRFPVTQRRLWGFHDRKLGPHVHYAYQALALDDERRTFHPLIWEHPKDQVASKCAAKCDANGTTKQIIEQVWFAGAHSNVGGGYPKDAMSLVSLDWMMGKAEECGLRFTNGVRSTYQLDADVHGRLYDPRSGLGVFYRYAPRNLYEQPANPLADDVTFWQVLGCTLKRFFRRLFEGKKMEALPIPAIHGSVFQRIQRGTDSYAPKVIRRNGDDTVQATVAWTNTGPYAKPRAWDESGDA